MADSKALAKVDKMLEKPVTDLTTLRSRMQELATVANLVTPVHSIDYLPPYQRVSLRAVLLNPDINTGRDVYKDTDNKEGERSLAKIGILKILQADGVSIISSTRTDDRSDPHVCSYQVFVEITLLDGKPVRCPGSRTVDLRDNSPQVIGWQPARLWRARRHIESNAETKALLRAVRAVLGLQHAYTEERLKVPFVVPTLVADPDLSDPEIRRMAAQKALGIKGQLYPASAGGELPEASGAVIEVAAGGEEPFDTTLPPMAIDDEPEMVCQCPCGHRVVVDDEAYASETQDILGDLRCKDCFPSSEFNLEMHTEVDDLRLPNRPGLTVARLKAWFEERTREGAK